MQFTKSFSVDVFNTAPVPSLDFEITQIENVDVFDFSTGIALDTPSEDFSDLLFATSSIGSPGYSSVSGSASAGVSNDGTVFAQAEGSVSGNATLHIDVTALSFDAFAFDFF